MKKYVLLYSNKKEEDNIVLTNMFPNNKIISIGWTEIDNNANKREIKNLVKDEIEELIFAGFEDGWDKLIRNLKEELSLPIKVICNTQDSLLYYEYERNNFFKLLELNKEGIVDCIGFLRKGQYELYNSLGYKCFYLLENFVLEKEFKESKKNKTLNIGVYPLNYTWDKNIFNQLCIAKMVDNCVLNYNSLDPRMNEFLETMHIESKPIQVKKTLEGVMDARKENDVVVSTSFTDYVHPVFFIAMEMGIPCLVGNSVDFLDGTKLKELVVTTTEDNPIVNGEKVKKINDNRENIIKEYRDWKKKYNTLASDKIKEFIDL